MVLNARYVTNNVTVVSSADHMAPPLIKKDGGQHPRPILGLQRNFTRRDCRVPQGDFVGQEFFQLLSEVLGYNAELAQLFKR